MGRQGSGVIMTITAGRARRAISNVGGFDVACAAKLHARAAGKSTEEVQAELGSSALLKRLPLVAEVANAATIMASDYASAMTGVIANVTFGYIVD